MEDEHKNPVFKIAWLLLIIGGLNWGLIGILNFDLVWAIFGSIPLLVKIGYVLVGLSALVIIYKKAVMKGMKKK